jgi:general secretion pathway protein D
MYSRASSTLVVKNTQEQLDLVDKVIEIVQNQGAIKQIEIQAKFVEITQNNLKELSFDWLLGPANVPGVSTNAIFFGGGTAGTAPAVDPADFVFQQGSNPRGGAPVTQGLRSGNLGISANAIDALLFGISGSTLKAPGVFSLLGANTDPNFQVVVRALDQKKGVDLLSAPRVTTKSGNRAVIEIIREFKYPIEFEQPQIPQTFGNTGGGTQFIPIGGGVNPLAQSSSGSFPVTPTTPTTFETRNTGVTLEVEPNILPDGASIEMQLAPQVVEFEGFINYGSPIQTTSTNALGQQIVNVITPNIINQPIFSTRKVTTNVTVYDGATVVLGGLVREDVQKVEDKIPLAGDLPLIGRLFRSNIDQHIKRNLVIFVTARIINAEGQPIQTDEEKEEKVDELPLPDVPSSALPDLSGFKK